MKKNNEFYTKDEFLAIDTNQIEKDKGILKQEIANYERHKTDGLRFYDTFTLASNNNLLNQVGYTNTEFVLDLTHFRYCTEKNAYYNLKLKDHKSIYELDYETKNYILKGLQKDNDNHFVGIEFLYKVPELLTHPIAIFAEKNHPDRQAIMLDYKHNGSYVMLAVKPNGQKMVNNINYPANFIHSIYANEKIEYKLSRQIMNEGSKFIGNTNDENNFIFYLDSKRATDVINEAYKKGKLRNSIYNETKKAIKVLDSENTQVSSRSSNLNGHINNIPNNEKIVNTKKEKFMEKTDLNSYLNEKVTGMARESKFSELLITSTIADRLNQMGIKTYVIDDKDKQLESELKEDKNSDLLLTLSDKKYYGFVHKDEIYLTEDGINASVLLHEYAHLWLEVYRLSSDKNEWDKFKNDILSSEKFNQASETYDRDIYSTNDSLFTEFVCDYISKTALSNNTLSNLCNNTINSTISNVLEVNERDLNINDKLKNLSSLCIKDLIASEDLFNDFDREKLNTFFALKTVYEISTKKEEEMRNGIKSKLTSYSDKKVNETVASIKDLVNEAKDELKTKTAKLAYKWVLDGTLILPEDKDKFKNALAVADKGHIDPFRYNSPVVLLEENTQVVLKEPPLDPDTIPTLTNKRVYDFGIVVYDVDESDESRVNMRKIINTHLGKNSSPWCLLQGDENGELTKQSATYWKYRYNKVKKQVAFINGKLSHFCASDDEEDRWWDTQDSPHDYIQVEQKIPGDPLDRIGIYDYDLSNGKALDKPYKIFKKTKNSYTTWHYDFKTIEKEDLYENGKLTSSKLWDSNGKLFRYKKFNPITGNIEEEKEYSLAFDGILASHLIKRDAYDLLVIYDSASNGIRDIYFTNTITETNKNDEEIYFIHIDKKRYTEKERICIQQYKDARSYNRGSEFYPKKDSSSSMDTFYLSGAIRNNQNAIPEFFAVYGNLLYHSIKAINPLEIVLSIQDREDLTEEEQKKRITATRLEELKKAEVVISLPRNGIEDKDADLEEQVARENGIPIIPYEVLERNNFLVVKSLLEVQKQEKIANSQNHQITNSTILHYTIQDQISAFKNSTFNRTDTFTIATLNPLLKQIGYTNDEITLDQTHMRYCLLNSYKGNDNEKANHFTGEEFFDKLPELLSSPIAIIPSNTKGDERQLIILDYKLNGSYVCMSIRADGQGMRNNKAFPSTHILSIYAKDTAEYILNKEIQNEIEHQKYVNKPCGIYYINNKKATEMLNGKGFQLPRSFNLNGHINNIPNINKSVNRKNEKIEKTYKNINFSNGLNLSFDEYALTNTIADLLNKVGINTYVITKDKLANLVEQKVKAATSDETLIYKTISDYEVYGCTKGKNIYLQEGAIKSDVLLHEYAHLWIETFRLSNPNEWDKIKTSLINDQEVVNALDRYSSILSPNTDDGKLVEYICDKIAENGKDLTFEKILSEDLSTLFECTATDELLKNISKCAIKDLVNSSTILKNANIPENVVFFNSKNKTLFDDDNETSEELETDNSLLDEKLKTDEYHFTPKRDEILEMVLFGSNENSKNDKSELKVLDYSTVESDKILLSNKQSILDKPYPSYLPPLHYGSNDVNNKDEKLFKIPATELRDGNYLITDSYLETYVGEDNEKHYKVHLIYYKVSLEVYAALKHYNTTFFRAIEEKRVNDNLNEINNAIDKENANNPNLGLSHLQKNKNSYGDIYYYITYNPNVPYDTIPKIKIPSLPYKYSFQGKPSVSGLTLKEYQNSISPIPSVYNTTINQSPMFYPYTALCYIPDDWSLTARKLIDRQRKHNMLTSTYNEIKETTQKIYNTELKNREIFRQWMSLQEKVSYLLNDMYYQEDNLMSSFQKGRETSYGDSNTQNTLLDDYGVLIKRQNGDAINEKETEELKNALDYTFSLYGKLSPILKENNIKLSHAGNVNQHASSAIGIWYPLYKAIGISFKNDEQAFSTSIHEFAHFLDYMKGQKTHHWHSSTIYGTIENTIASTFRDKTHPPTKYYSSTPECFARCMQLYAASLKFFNNREIDLNSIETLEYREIEALNEGFLKENPNFDNTKITGNLHTICTKVNDYEPPISLFKVCQNFISETRELLNVDEYKTNSVISPSTIQDQVSAFKNSTFNRTDTFTIATLNPLLKQIGYTNDEITLDQTHMRYCLFNSYKGNDNEKANHFTGEEFFDKLPELLSSPIAIIPSNTKGDERQLIILDYKLNGSYVCLSVRADGVGLKDSKKFKSTHIFSICAKEQTEYILNCRINEEIEHQKYANKPYGIYYIDNKKATEALIAKGFELPRGFMLNGHINNIPNINKSVNRKNEKNEEILSNSQNHKISDSAISSDETPNYEIQAPVRDENINSRKTLTPSAKEETMDDRNTVNNGNALLEQLKQNGINESSLLAFLRENPTLFDQIKDFSEKSEKTRENDLTEEGEKINITFSNIKNETEEHEDVSNRREDDRTLRRSITEEEPRERVDVVKSPDDSRELPIPEIREMSESREEGRQTSTDWNSDRGRGLSQHEGRADKDLQLEGLSDTTENNIPRYGEIPTTDGILSSSDRSLGSETSRAGSTSSDGGELDRSTYHSRMGVVLSDGRRDDNEADLNESTPTLDDANIKAKDALSIRESVKNILETKTDDEITREDRAILRQYEGVGGLKEESTTVEGALSEFYTPSSLVKKVWELVDAYAPDAYTVLEPTCGSGRFLQGRSDNLFTCYECDKTSARIAKILYPNATINNDYFQSQFLSNSRRSLRKDVSIKLDGVVINNAKKYDLVIGNPPYGKARDIFSSFNLYASYSTYPEFFINEGLLHLKQGGLLAFVVPSSVLDGIGKDLQHFERKFISYQHFNGDEIGWNDTPAFWARILRNNSLVDAYRLPEGIFPSTKIGTDIIILRHESDIPINSGFSDDKIHTFYTKDGKVEIEADISYGTYIDRVKKVQNFFTDHPERILGEVKTRLNRARTREETYVDFKEGETKEDVFNRIVPFESERRERTREVIPPKFAVDETTGEVEKAPVSQKQKTIKAPRVHANSPLAKVMNADDFLKKYNLNYSENDKEIWKATAYNGSIDIKNLSENALSYLKSSDNYIEIERDEYYLKSLYVVGNIYTKLDDIEKKFDKGYIDRNRYEDVKKLLEDHLPTPLTMDKIHFSPLTEFARNFTVERKVVESYFQNGRSYEEENMREIPLITAFYQWAVNSNKKYISHYDYDPATSPIRKEEFYSEKCDIRWRSVIDYINREPITPGISSTDDKETKDLKQQEALVKREERKRISENLFDRFLHEGLNEKDKAKLIREYNRIFNAVIEPDYSKIPFFVDGMSTHKGDKEFTLHPIQLRGASFLQSKGSGLLAYDVGVGKTATGIIATVAQIQSGRAKRPLIVVPKPVYNKWYEDIKQLFPNIEINNLYNFSYDYLRPFRKGEHGLDIKEGSISLATMDGVMEISFKDESINENGILKEDLSDLLSLSDDGTNRERALEKQGLFSRYGEAVKARDDNFVFFEECGFDHITIDEAHNFKNLFSIPRKRRGESNEYEGLAGGKPSKRAIKLYCMTSLVQHQNHDRNVFLLTATPFTNHPFEVFSILSFMGRKRMKELQIGSLRDFADKFAETKSDYAVTAKGEVEFKQSMKNWRCLRELQGLLFEYIDRVTAEEAGVIRPEKIVHPVYIQMTPLQEKIRDAECDRIVFSDEKAATLKAIGNNKKASVSPCILKENYDFELPEITEFVQSSPKLTVTLDTISTLYKENPNCGQVMYCDIAVDYFPLMKQYLIDKGISENAVASITGDTSDNTRKTICDAFNDENNPLKILIGSSAIKEGIDLNGNTIALYNISLGWNPSETVQIEGRVWRQGNAQGKVHIVYPLTEDSVDAFIYQKFEEKSKRIDALWDYKGDKLNTEDINPEEMKFALIKDPEKKAKLFVNSEKEKLENSLKLIELEEGNYTSLRNLLVTEKVNKEDLEKQKERLEKDKVEGRSNAYIEERKSLIKDIEKELRLTEKSKEKFNLFTIEDVDRVLKDFTEKKENIKRQISSAENKASLVLEQYKKEFEEERKKERRELSLIITSLASDIGSNLVKAKASEEPKTIETTFNESTQSYESASTPTPSTTTVPITETPNLQGDKNITTVIENITPVISADKNNEIKTENTATLSQETIKPQEKPRRSRKAKIVVDDFYSGTLFDFITEEPALLIAKNGFYGQKEIGENLIAKLQKANIPVVEINDKERRFLESSLKAHNSSITDDFHLYGYAENGKIYLSPFGINPETVIHEYTHLWGECIKASNPELFERIKKEVLATDEFKQLLRNDAYENIKNNEDAMCLEALAVLSGDENTERLETLLNPQNGKISDSDKKIEEALSTTWKFTDEMLFSHHSHNLSLKEITSHILDDAFNSISLEDVKRKYKFQYSELFDENEEFTFDTDKALVQGYASLSHELLNQYFSLRPYMSDETKQHYKDWLSSSIKKDGRQTAETLVRYIEEETISQQFFKRFVNDYKDESVKNYIESIFEKNDSENFASAFESGFTLHSLNFYADRERNQTYLHFANFLHSEVLKEKNPVALNCLKQFISENNSPELIRFLMLTVGAKDQNSYENRILIRSLLPNVEVRGENNKVHMRQQDFGILDSECFVTSKVYSTLFVGNPLDGKKSKLTLDEKAISLSEEFKSAFSDIDAKRIENSIKDMKAIEIKSNLSYFDKARRDKALLKGDMEKLKKIDSHIREKLTTYTYSISNETDFSIESVDSLTNIKDGSLTIPAEILSDFGTIAKNAIKVKTLASEDGNIETLYSSPIKYKDKEYDFTFTLTNENGETVLKEKSLNLSLRDKKKHSLISEENYIDKDTGEIKSDFIKEIMSGGKSLHEIERERYIDSLYLTRSVNQNIFEGLRKEYLEEKGLPYEPLQDEPTSLLYDEDEENIEAKEEVDQEEETIETEPEIVLNNKETAKEETTMAVSQTSNNAFNILDDESIDYDDEETDDLDYTDDDGFDYSTPSPTPEELKQAFYEEYNKALREDAAFSLVKERKEREAAWAEEKRLAQEEGKKQAVRYYEISKNCSIPVNNPYLLSHGLDASIAEKNGVHYNMKYRQLQIPLYSNKDGELCNIQRIYDDGRKYNIKGAEVGHAVIGEQEGDAVFICEGWATGAAIHEATGGKVYCAMSCINYKKVVDFIKRENPNTWIIAIADRNPPQLGERYGVGEKYARESGALETLVIPDTGDPNIKDAADFAKVYDLGRYIFDNTLYHKEATIKNEEDEKVSSSLTIKPKF